eukprot:20223-Heterococcus_DN1.PRE.5
MESSLLALFRASTVLVVAKVIPSGSRCFSDLRDITSRAWVRVEISLAIKAKQEVVMVCLHNSLADIHTPLCCCVALYYLSLNREVAYVTLPSSGAIDKYVKSVAVKFGCWSAVRRYWDRLWQPNELIGAAYTVLGTVNTISTIASSLLKAAATVNRKKSLDNDTTATTDANAYTSSNSSIRNQMNRLSTDYIDDTNDVAPPDWLLRKLLCMQALSIEDFEASSNTNINKLQACIGVCSRDSDKQALQAIVQLALDTAAIKQVADASKAAAAAAAAASFINSEDTDNESESDSSENDTDTDDSETTGITKKKNKSSNNSKKKSKLAPIAVVQNSRNELLPALTTFNVDLKRLGLSPYDIIRLPAILTKLRLSDGTPQSLLLDGNAITSNAAVTILNSVKDSYQHISFALGSISNSGAMKSATCLLPDISNSLSNTTVTAYSMVSLDLSWSGVGATGLKAITTICTGAEGGSAISRALKQNNTLTHLNLSFCSLGCDANVDGWSNSSNSNSNSSSNSQYKGLQTPQHYHSQQQGTPQSANSNGDSQASIRLSRNHLSQAVQTPHIHDSNASSSSSTGTNTAQTAMRSRNSSRSSMTLGDVTSTPTTNRKASIRTSITHDSSLAAVNYYSVSGGGISGRALCSAFTTTGNSAGNTTLCVLDVTGSSLKQSEISALTAITSGSRLSVHSSSAGSYEAKATQLEILSEWRGVRDNDSDDSVRQHVVVGAVITSVYMAHKAQADTVCVVITCASVYRFSTLLLLQLLTYLRNKLLQHNALVQLPEDTDTTATSNKDAATTGSDNDDNEANDDDVDINDLIDSFIAEKTHEEVLIDSYLAAHTAVSEEERKKQEDDRPFSLGGILYLNDPNAATPLEHVGTALITVNDLTTAKYHLLESVAIRENLLGPCSPETAAYLLRLSSLQNTVFNLPRAAEATLKRCLLASEEFFRIIADAREGRGVRGQRGGVSAQAPRTLAVYPAALSSIGLLLMDADRLLEAKGYLGKALEADRALYGRDHPEVAGDLTNLAVLFCSLEGKGGALTEKFLRRSLEVFEAARRQGRCNASTLADAVNNVAAAVRLRGQFEEDAEVAFAVELEDMRLKQIDAALALRWQIEGHHNNMTAQQIQEDRVAVEEALAEAVDKRRDEVNELSKELITHPMIGLKLQEAKDLYQASLSILDKRGPANTNVEREEIQRRVADVTRKIHGANTIVYNKAMIPVTVGLINDQQYNAAEQVLQNYILPELIGLLKEQQEQDGNVDEICTSSTRVHTYS